MVAAFFWRPSGGSNCFPVLAGGPAVAQAVLRYRRWLTIDTDYIEREIQKRNRAQRKNTDFC